MRISVAIAVLAACSRQPRDLVVRRLTVESHVALNRLRGGVMLSEDCAAFRSREPGALLMCGSERVSVVCAQNDRDHPETIQAKSIALLAWCE